MTMAQMVLPKICSSSSAVVCVSSTVSCSKALQMDRLKEAVSTGAKKMISPCLKCSIHFNCAQTGELPVPRKKVEIEVVDLTSFLAEAAGLKKKKSKGKAKKKGKGSSSKGGGG